MHSISRRLFLLTCDVCDLFNGSPHNAWFLRGYVAHWCCLTPHTKQKINNQKFMCISSLGGVFGVDANISREVEWFGSPVIISSTGAMDLACCTRHQRSSVAAHRTPWIPKIREMSSVRALFMVLAIANVPGYFQQFVSCLPETVSHHLLCEAVSVQCQFQRRWS